jgi:hypothetical protein
MNISVDAKINVRFVAFAQFITPWHTIAKHCKLYKTCYFLHSFMSNA